MSEVTKLVLVQFAVTLVDGEVAECRGRIVGPGADLEPDGWPAFAEGGQFNDDIVDCAEALFLHAGSDLWECALDVIEDPEALPPDPFEDLGALTAERDALRAELAEALALLDGGRLYQEDGTEIPTTLVERARWQGAALGAEKAEADRLRAEVAVLHATGRVTADDLIAVCMGDCGAITEEDADGCCAGCGNDTALVVGIGSSEAILEAFEARERKHGPRELAGEPITHDRNGNPVYPHSWLRFDAAKFGRETPPFRLSPVWLTPIGLLTDVPRFCDVVDDPGEVAP